MADSGIANERTALAWQRTALSLVAGAAIIARLAVDETGPAVLVPLFIAALLGAGSSSRARPATAIQRAVPSARVVVAAAPRSRSRSRRR
ncbi:DUF202 domain-containing protein [Nocardioides alcanivorans]|uniref:DUF202 domain-containing protein n=1 Tax=Nocardioides alcanivorans TaxID=2897352 RepID=UPI001F2692BE|nr:DUF202 domain-containing protein [Nocardioides alcanivorans]